MNKKLFQGDVAYIPISEKQLKKLLNGKKFNGKKIEGTFTIAHGESGNHHNIVVDRDTDNQVELMEVGNGMFALKVKGKVIATHEKHIPSQILPSGFYFVTQKTEYYPNEERLVRD